MLQINGGVSRISGRKIDLLVEFAQLVRHLREKEIFSDEDIKMCIEVASMTEDELAAKTEEMENKAMSHFLDDLRKCLDELDKAVNKSE